MFFNQKQPWQIWFAWYPVRTISGKMVWLKHIERKFNPLLNDWCDSSGYSGSDGGYDYRLLPISYKEFINYGKAK